MRLILSDLYPLYLHDALPISDFDLAQFIKIYVTLAAQRASKVLDIFARLDMRDGKDRKSTRLNSSHRTISYAVFCLKKKILADLTRLQNHTSLLLLLLSDL